MVGVGRGFAGGQAAGADGRCVFSGPFSGCVVAVVISAIGGGDTEEKGWLD